MQKNIINKLATAGIAASVFAVVALSNPFSTGANNSGYGYGYGQSPIIPTVNCDSRVSGTACTTTTNTTNNTTTTTTTTKTEDKTETVAVGTDIQKELNGKKYSYTNGSQHVAIVNKLLKNSIEGFNTKFTDIANSSAKEDIVRLEMASVVKGTTPTTYEPNRAITRAEFLAIVLGSYDYNVYASAKNLPFSDVKADSWQARVVSVALENKIITDANSTFRPNAQISKIEALAILYKISGFKADVKTTSFIDAAADWQTAVLAQAEYLELVKVPADKKFNPNAGISRADMANTIVNFAKLY